MKHTEIENMEAGRPIDFLIAEKAMKWVPVGIDGLFWKSPQGNVLHCTQVPRYSKSIFCAWDVVETLEERDGLLIGISRREDENPDNSLHWTVWLGVPGSIKIYIAFADTAPLAICRAALTAMIDQ